MELMTWAHVLSISSVTLERINKFSRGLILKDLHWPWRLKFASLLYQHPQDLRLRRVIRSPRGLHHVQRPKNPEHHETSNNIQDFQAQCSHSLNGCGMDFASATREASIWACCSVKLYQPERRVWGDCATIFIFDIWHFPLPLCFFCVHSFLCFLSGDGECFTIPSSIRNIPKFYN